MNREPIFRDVELGAQEREALDRDGHVAFPGLLTDAACRRLACSLDYIDSIRAQVNLRRRAGSPRTTKSAASAVPRVC